MQIKKGREMVAKVFDAGMDAFRVAFTYNWNGELNSKGEEVVEDGSVGYFSRTTFVNLIKLTTLLPIINKVASVAIIITLFSAGDLVGKNANKEGRAMGLRCVICLVGFHELVLLSDIIGTVAKLTYDQFKNRQNSSILI